MQATEIRNLRRHVEVGQHHLANALGIPRQRPSEMECGYASIPEGFEERVREALQQILQQRMNAVGMQ